MQTGPGRRSVTRSVGIHHRPLGILFAALWFGLLAGLGGVLVRQLYPPAMRSRVWSPWLVAPLVDVCVFGLAGVAVCVLTWPPRARPLRGVAVFGLAVLACLGPLLQVPWLHRYAALLVAGGLATQLVALMAKHPRAARRWMRASGAAMALIVVVLAAAATVVQTWRERRALERLAPAAPNAPNVLLVTMCSVRAGSLSCYGHERPTTPQLAKLAESGVLYRRALATAPWTCPSHASMFTGRLPHELSVDYLAPLDATYPTLAEALRARGYVTAGFVGNYLYCGSAAGVARGFVHYEDYPAWPREGLRVSALGQLLSSFDLLKQFTIGFDGDLPSQVELTRKSAARLNRDLLHWLQRSPRRPFFAFVNYFDAHEPYVPPPPFDAKFRSAAVAHGGSANNELGGIPWQPLAAAQDERESKLLRYEQCIAYIDDQLGALLDELARRGELANTLVIVTGDHGEQFSEHGREGHGNSLYRQVIQVPLVISWPGHLPQGVTVQAPVSLREIPATVLEQLDLANDLGLPGVSLARFLDPAATPLRTTAGMVVSDKSLTASTRPSELAANGSQQSFVAAGSHLIVDYPSGRYELYDFDSDPLDERDLAGTQEGQSRLKAMRTAIETTASAPTGRAAAPRGIALLPPP